MFTPIQQQPSENHARQHNTPVSSNTQYFPINTNMYQHDTSQPHQSIYPVPESSPTHLQTQMNTLESRLNTLETSINDKFNAIMGHLQQSSNANSSSTPTVPQSNPVNQ